MVKITALLFLAFIAVFAFVVASHVAGESRALLAGVTIGAIASIPASLMAALLARRSAERVESVAPLQPVPARRTRQGPSIYIVTPGNGVRAAHSTLRLDAVAEPPEPRTFTLVGGDETTAA